MAPNDQQIIQDIADHHEKCGGFNYEWYVGATDDPQKALFKDHFLSQEHSVWLYRQASSAAAAEDIVRHYLDAGFDGDGGSFRSNATYVYAYSKNTAGTNLTGHCRVEPEEPEVAYLQDFSGHEDSQFGIQIGVWIGSCILAFAVLGNLPEGKPWWLWLSPFVIATLAAKGVVIPLREKAAIRQRDAKNENNRFRSVRDAENATARVQGYVKESVNTLISLKGNMQRTASFIQNAKHEFAENAYAPFWDQIHNAIESLYRCKENVEHLSRHAETYTAVLAGRRHNFPPFPIAVEMIPDLKVLTADLQQVIRQGQTNFEFSSIYEERRTREVLIAGFNSLGEAVNNIGKSVDSSFSQFLRKLELVLKK